MKGSEADSRRDVVLVSACLLGLPTRYDGSHCRSEQVASVLETHCLVPVCPEQLGGLGTPRPPSEIRSGSGGDVLDGRSRVVTADGADVTAQFVRGARIVAELAECCGARRAIFKEGSPSCGVSRIKRDGRDGEGEGVTSALLRRKGIEVDGIE